MSRAKAIRICTNLIQTISKIPNDIFRKNIFEPPQVRKAKLVKIKNQLIKEYGLVEPHTELPVNYYNKNYDLDNKTIGIDINNAYWSIAYLKNYITKKTFLRGLQSKEFKPIRLSALSSLGKPRVWKVYESGSHRRNEITEGNKELQDVYLDIRYTTYAVMQEIADALGKNFHSWKTDCVFFKETKENKLLVETILDGYCLEYKMEKL